jgi:ankyrin repeat protein
MMLQAREKWISHGKVIAARYFINKDADLNKQDHKGFMPLHYAATKVNEGMAHLLISGVACVDVPVAFVRCCDETMVTSWLLLLLNCVGWQPRPPPMPIENFDGCGMICPMCGHLSS